jgi:hypothetical protein
MNFASAFNILTVHDSASHETSFEFYLNRLGINLIEIPRENIWAEIGGTLRLIFKTGEHPPTLPYLLPMQQCIPILSMRIGISLMKLY